MNCPYCRMLLEKKDINFGSTFPCLCCHKQLRARPDRRARFLEFIAGLGGVLTFVFGQIFELRNVRRAGELAVILIAIAALAFRSRFPLEIEPSSGPITAEEHYIRR